MRRLSSDYSDNVDITSDKTTANDLLSQQTVAEQDLLHACQNAAHQ